jgi:AcrR family transcriptional regulator
MARPVRKLEDIEAAAIRLFAERGVGRVTTKEIAREAGCAEGALYRHYAGMDEMAWRLFKREVEKFGRTLKEILEQDISYSERIHQSVSFFYRFFDKDPVTFRFILLSEHQFPLPQKIDRKFNPDTLVFEFVRKGVRDGIFHIREGDL